MSESHSEELVFDDENLPNGWIKIALDQIIEPSKEKFNPQNSDNRIFLGLEHIESNNGRILEKGNSIDTKSTKTIFNKGDILYGRLRPYLNKICVPLFDGVCSTDILVFPQNPYRSSKYIAFLLSQSKFVRFANRNSTGVQHPRIKFDIMSQFQIPLPPLNEQKRIVTKVESIFSQIDACREKLDKIKVLLKQDRQSMLRDIFENKKYTYVQLGDFLTLEYGKGLSKKDRKKGSIPVFGSAGINGYHNKALVEKSSLIIGRKGNVGNVILVEQPFWPIDTTYFLNETQDFNVKFLFYLFNHLDFVRLDSSTTIPSLRRDDIYMQNIPFLSILEQQQIVTKIESIFGRIDAIFIRIKIINLIQDYIFV